MTNTSAEKSLNHSMATDSLNETRIKENIKKPMDLIAEYRSTIMQRYTEKVLQGSIISKIQHSDEKPMEKTSHFEDSEEKKQLLSAKSQKVLT
jgi:CRISPR/Cas system CMR-associated protein Cmr5 small subunit